LDRWRQALFALVTLLYVAGLPGTVLRAVAVELTAPELPKTIQGRDGVLDVIVRGKVEAGPLAGAKVHAFAILDGKAHAAGEDKAIAASAIEAAELALILEGIDLAGARRRPRWEPSPRVTSWFRRHELRA
jgi:hypothetical protein